MGAIVQYFRLHPWQRRAATALLAVTGGFLAALGLYPQVKEYLIIRDLGSGSPAVRNKAIYLATQVARTSPRMLRSLEDALDSPDQTKFLAVAAVLRRLAKFHVPRRNPVHVDRLAAIEIEQTRSSEDPNSAAALRGNLLSEVILAGRDNPYVRRALASTAGDESAPVRSLSGVLAARLGDEPTLKKLLDDKDARVCGRAALDAGLAGVDLAKEIGRLLWESQDPDAVSSAAYALAMLTPKESSPRLTSLLKETKDELLRDRLLHVMTILKTEEAGAAVAAVIDRSQAAGKNPPAAAIEAAGTLRIPGQAKAIAQTLAEVTKTDGDLTEAHLLAALQAADRMKLPVRSEVFDICLRLWNPRRFQLTLTKAARVLGRQGDLLGAPNAPSRQECVKLLQQRAVYEVPRTTHPATHPASAPAGMSATGPAPVATTSQEGGSKKPSITPVPSAAAAAALWDLQAPLADQFVRNASAAAVTLAGEYVAWHVAAGSAPGAFELGLKMLPALDAPPALRVYNDNERSAGAILLALSAGTDSQKKLAMDRITSRLEGGPLGGEDDFFVIRAYWCAQLILGKSELATMVLELLDTPDFPQRRAFTALCVAGRREALDWLLWDPNKTAGDIGFLLIDKGLEEVLSAVAPGLPGVDDSAGDDLLAWQIRILQDSYAIHRSSLKLGLTPEGR